jgi:hypothetical protein
MRRRPVEATTEDQRDGRVCGSADAIGAGQHQWQGLWVSAPEVEFGYLVAKKALQGAITTQQKSRLQELRQKLGTKAEAITRRLFGSRLGERVTQWIRTENWAALECYHPRLRRALLWQALWHDPLNFLRYSVPEGTRLWRQWRHPQQYRTGRSVPPHQPGQGCSGLRQGGGLLLLALLYLITGCTGSRTHEMAAFTHPPASRKMVVDQVSSSKAKPGASPHSKARTSMTPGKPAAPQPSPQQPGEEQEGRIF